VSIVYLGLGTNLGDRNANIDHAIEGLAEEVLITALSPIYETDAWGVEEQPDFLNMCVAGETKLSPNSLLLFVKQLESRLGRIASERWGPRLIDIDILFYDSLVLLEPTLTIPHKGVVDRATVLVPLADIAPDLLHPIQLKCIRELLESVDKSGVWLFQEC
jgi:2-amino-4-hydroxy-6-hydroxymethyldihydropteridine diphosphokinase